MTSTSPAAGGRVITGRMVLAALVAFFGVIFAANAALIYLAVESFPGLEVESSYKAGQEFNQEVAAAAAQAARGWHVDLSNAREGSATRITARFLDKAGVPQRGLQVTVALEHPTDNRHDRGATLVETGPGVYEAAVEDVGAGRWVVSLEADADGALVFRSRNQVALVE